MDTDLGLDWGAVGSFSSSPLAMLHTWSIFNRKAMGSRWALVLPVEFADFDGTVKEVLVDIIKSTSSFDISRMFTHGILSL